MKLTEAQRGTPLWRDLTEHFEKRLAALRTLNDQDASETTTAKTRGRILQIKEFLALALPTPEQEADED